MQILGREYIHVYDMSFAYMLHIICFPMFLITVLYSLHRVLLEIFTPLRSYELHLYLTSVPSYLYVPITIVPGLTRETYTIARAYLLP